MRCIGVANISEFLEEFVLKVSREELTKLASFAWKLLTSIRSDKT